MKALSISSLLITVNLNKVSQMLFTLYSRKFGEARIYQYSITIVNAFMLYM
jgi:hypothetical protein